jgi:TonB family protein
MRKLFLVPFILVALSVVAVAAQEVPVRWHRAAPETEAFSVLMPEPPMEVRRDIPLSPKFKLTTPVYEVTYKGILFSVLSIDKRELEAEFKSSAGLVYGLRYAVLSSSRVRDSEFTFERAVTLKNQTARQYLVRAEGTEGTAQIHETATHYYVLMTLGGRGFGLFASNFFNSFTPNAKRARAASDIVSIPDISQPSPPAPMPLWPIAGTDSITGGVGSGMAPPAPDSSDAPPAARKPKPSSSKIIDGGALDGKVSSKPQPGFPAAARSVRVQGAVTVEVIVDEEGSVISARATNGHPFLQPSAVQAARLARFTPTLLSGEPVKVRGVITYNFVLDNNPAPPVLRPWRN